MMKTFVRNVFFITSMSLSATISTIPTLLNKARRDNVAYVPLRDLPFCIAVYQAEGRAYLYFDVAISFIIPSIIILIVVLGNTD